MPTHSTTEMLDAAIGSPDYWRLWQETVAALHIELDNQRPEPCHGPSARVGASDASAPH